VAIDWVHGPEGIGGRVCQRLVPLGFMHAFFVHPSLDSPPESCLGLVVAWMSSLGIHESSLRPESGGNRSAPPNGPVTEGDAGRCAATRAVLCRARRPHLQGGGASTGG
jgi:hypothetical protein